MKRLLGVLAALFGTALVLAVPASAHAELEGSTPSDGARLAKAPASVSVRFDEAVGIGYVHVVDGSGRRVESGSADHPRGDGKSIGVALQHGLRDGTYTVSFRVISDDSHPVAGTIRFVVGNGPLTAAPADAKPASGGGVGVGLDIARWFSTAGFALLGGAWLLIVAGASRRGRRMIWTGWGAATVGAVAEVLLQGTNAAGAPATSLFRWSLIDATLHTDYGQWHSARLLMLGLVALLLGPALAHKVWAQDVLVPLGLALAGTFAASGHAATTTPVGLSLVSDTLHLASIAVWVGGLAVLGLDVLPRRDGSQLMRVLPIFSRTAFTSVVLIAATGTYAAWRGTGSWRALFETTYGLLIIAKVVGFVGLLALGNLSRRVIQKRVRRPVVAYAMTDDVRDEPAPALGDIPVERMRRSVLVEVVVAAVVLALAAVLVGRPRGQDALAAADRAPVTASAAVTADQSVHVRVAPGRHGVVAITVDLDAGRSTPHSLTATAAQPKAQLGPIPVRLVRAGADSWSAAGVNLPVAGTWVVTLVVTYSTYSAVTAEVRISLS